MGVQIHREIARKGIESDVFVGTGLVDFYSKLGKIGLAREVFDKIPELDVVAWNAMIAGFSQSLEPFEALGFFLKMQLAGIEPNSVSLLNLFPAISQLSSILLCRSIHGFIIRRKFSSRVSNGLIDMYSKCGDVDFARRVFDRMCGRDDGSWGTMMAGFVHNSCFVEALELFDGLKRENLKLNQVSAVSALSAAGEIRDFEKGKEIHDYSVRAGIDSDILVATPLMTMYAKCGELEKAKQTFEGIPRKDIVAWSAIIAAFVQTGHPKEALSLFRDMQRGNLKPNRVTIMGVLPACGELSALNLGKSIHCYVIKADIGSDVSTGTALVAMYAKCRLFTVAHILFNRLQQKDVVTWNALINGYAQIGDGIRAMEMFHQFQFAGHHPDSGTIVGVLPACVIMDALDQGTCIHGKIIKFGFEADLHVKNALIDMYAKCGDLTTAEYLFNETEFTKDEISWNIIIAGYMQNGRAKEAIAAFHQMRSESVWPNLVTIVSILPAAAYLAALREGMALHAYVIHTGFGSNVLIGNSLIDMYAKCGRLDYSEQFFDQMKNKDTVSWNVMLSGYAIHGLGNSAVALFLRMQESCIQVDSVSFVSVLSACRHGGLIEEGRKVFDSMNSKHQIEPKLEHYACMVDLLGRAGELDEAWNFIQKMPMAPDAGVWGALLGACRMHSNVWIGEIALNHLVRLEPQNAAHHVVLSNIYAQSGRWGDVGKMRRNMNSLGLKKMPGCSWVEIKNKVHAFRVGDQTHPQFENMRKLWDDLLEKMETMGYVPDTSCVLHNVEEEEKESFLFSHSERLAITFALLNTEPGIPINIVKNLRVCLDCHTTIKLISQITVRKIIVRDASRFHHFEKGTCSCRDYW
ncbi:Pentatricopeptide repeat [Macleaya cordata]|uniref:Pentatricopeptide repeat n=1 Tax=Macleaya cordata TaxID=56857 RepID=A0A200R2G9_MACCD|nr:Pentatricopeptide repeat [Macleaya cordata]